MDHPTEEDRPAKARLNEYCTKKGIVLPWNTGTFDGKEWTVRLAWDGKDVFATHTRIKKAQELVAKQVMQYINEAKAAPSEGIPSEGIPSEGVSSGGVPSGGTKAVLKEARPAKFRGCEHVYFYVDGESVPEFVATHEFSPDDMVVVYTRSLGGTDLGQSAGIFTVSTITKGENSVATRIMMKVAEICAFYREFHQDIGVVIVSRKAVYDELLANEHNLGFKVGQICF